ncbi:uncharacterized protein [Nicotiana sylvestris]|uniref:uncharacterized protein n=1 Tax=Nicotiana sylvestris TaxID=4096 RepID=UPI00388C75EC
MFFYLTTLSLQKFFKKDVLVLPDETPENERFLVIEAWKHSDFLCKNYVLGGLEDDLYNVCSCLETSKELWTMLEKKYKTEDVGLVINEAFQVAAMIEKLPPLWKDFKNNLKHKRKEMSLKDLIVGNPKKWWIDSGATRHVCAVREAFATYAPIGPEETLSMGNAATAKIEGCGKIFLKMTSGKVVTLNNVLHVPEIRKNLVSVGLLVKNGFTCIFVSDKVVISKNEIFVRKGYLTEGLFKVNELWHMN